MDSILIDYDDVIRCPSFSAVKYMLDNKSKYEDIIDFSTIDGMDDSNLLRLCLLRNDENIIRYLSRDNIKNVNFVDVLNGIVNKCQHFFLDAPLLTFTDNLNIFSLDQKLSGVYVYYPVLEKKVVNDIVGIVPNTTNIKFLFGDIMNFIKDKKPSLIVTANRHMVQELINDGISKDIEILLSGTRYNYKVSDKGAMIANLDDPEFTVGIFKPLEFRSEHFTDIRR